MKYIVSFIYNYFCLFRKFIQIHSKNIPTALTYTSFKKSGTIYIRISFINYKFTTYFNTIAFCCE